jgi:exodeoxyribonuclease V beta subunit
MLRLKKTYGRFSDLLKNRYEQEYKNSFAVELNNVYVALTRSVWELYVMIPERTGNSINPVRFLIPEDVYTLGEQRKSKSLSIKTQTPSLLLKANLDRRWVSQLRQDSANEDQEQVQLRWQGIIMHFCLSQMTRFGEDMSICVHAAVDQAKEKFGLRMDEKLYVEQLSVFLSRLDVQRFFNVEADVDIVCEQEIINRFGDAKRIDRLMVFKEKVWVIDFKTSRHREDVQQKQIQEYTQLIAGLYPKHKIEGFLIYLT